MSVFELFACLYTLTEKYNFLGISIVGQSNERGDGGIYIGSIMKGGAVAADGRIEPGDMLLQVKKKLGVALRKRRKFEKMGLGVAKSMNHLFHISSLF